MKKRMLPLLLCLTLALSLLAGCGGTTPPAPTPTALTTDPGAWIGPGNTASAPPSAEVGPIALTDQTGRTILLDAPAQKIVSGYYISTSACIALGLTERMVGIEKKLINIYDLAAPGFAALPKVGTAKEFDLEGCLALNPDLVILPKKLKDAAETIAEHGISVLLVNPENQEQLVEMLQLIGKATGTEDVATSLSTAYTRSSGKLELLDAQVTQRPVVFLGGNGAYLSTAPKNMYQATLIRMGGGSNAGDAIEGDAWTDVSYEQLLAMNPDVILLPSDASYTVDDVKGDPQLSALTAVKEGKVFAMPNVFEAWDSPVPSCFLGSEWIMSVLHPDLLPIETLRQDAADFYKEFYGITIDSTQILGSMS